MKKSYFLSLCLLLTINFCFSQEEVLPLWPDEIPNHKKSNETETHKNETILWIENVQEPNLKVYLPTKQSATGKAVVICPGGGYHGLAYDWEGTDIAKWLNSKGIAAFVLKYRLPRSSSVIEGHKAPLQDVKRAMRLVRHHAGKWNISTDQVGIMGFSAGGHLASTLGTHYEAEEDFLKTESINTLSARPDFMILIYPVITMKHPYAAQGSRNNLLGNDPDDQLLEYYSNELHVTKDTPPTFLVHSTDDEGVPVQNSILFYQALQKEGVYSEMHIYPEGGHGYSLAIGKGYLQTWPDRLYDWLQNLK